MGQVLVIYSYIMLMPIFITLVILVSVGEIESPLEIPIETSFCFRFQISHQWSNLGWPSCLSRAGLVRPPEKALNVFKRSMNECLFRSKLKV